MEEKEEREEGKIIIFCFQVNFNNIHIRYEDEEVGGASNPLVVGLIIDRITTQSTNEEWVS